MALTQVAESPDQGPRLYRDLAEWYPLLTPVADYAEEAAFYRRLFETHCQRPPRCFSVYVWSAARGHDMSEPTPRFWEVFFEVFEPLPRQGPGSRACAEKALTLCRDLRLSPAVLDLGCGVGGQTLPL
jgi:hypothetical protein